MANESDIHHERHRNLTLKHCSLIVPKTSQYYKSLSHHPEIYGILAAVIVISLITSLIYLEEIIFIRKHFKKRSRRKRTLWILALFPVYSTTSLLGILVPRSGLLVDLVADGFFGTCLYQFLGLVINYVGGHHQLWRFIHGKIVPLSSLPLLCCCCCLPSITFNRRKYRVLAAIVLQVAIIRPLLSFIAAILLLDGTYVHGSMTPRSSFAYLALLNIASTIPAMLALILLRTALGGVLDGYVMAGKMFCIQAVLFWSMFPHNVITFLEKKGILSCTSILPSTARGTNIYHVATIVVMLLLSVIARVVYRRERDGHCTATTTPAAVSEADRSRSRQALIAQYLTDNTSSSSGIYESIRSSSPTEEEAAGREKWPPAQRDSPLSCHSYFIVPSGSSGSGSRSSTTMVAGFESNV